MHKSITILGSTGSIGQSTIRVIDQHPDKYKVKVLTAYNNVELLIKQAIHLQPEKVVIGRGDKYLRLKEGLAKYPNIKISAGQEAIIDAAKIETDLTMAAVVGIAGLLPTLEAVKRGTTVALANKECLVAAGDIFMAEVKKYGATLLPVDSEHNAVFQVFDRNVDKIILTASGGPFREKKYYEMENAIPEEVVAHPNWDMGAKISVDSATMMNKGLEIIEAHHLFSLPSEKIEVLVHPESIIHGMAVYSDGSVLSQMSNPDMCTPIAHTLAYPERVSAPVKPLNFKQSLNFYPPDHKKFPALKLARTALKEGRAMPAIMNGANEVAVNEFLEKKIGFLDIIPKVEKCMNEMSNFAIKTIDDVMEADKVAREKTISNLAQA